MTQSFEPLHIFCKIKNVITNAIKMGRTKILWNNRVYCQLDMLVNMVKKGFNNSKSQIVHDFPYSLQPQNHPCWNHRPV